MIKKVVLIALFVLFAGALIYGAVNRTTAKSETAGRIATQNQAVGANNPGSGEHEPQNGLGSQGQGNQGQGNQGQGSQGQGSQGQGNQGQGSQGQRSQSQGNQGLGNQGQGNQGQGGGNGQGRGRNQQSEAAEMQAQITIEGIVTQAPSAGVDMILETSAGDVLIGTGPGYLADQGFIIVNGDSLSVSGVWENEEFKAAVITQIDNGTSIVLRDEWGRPMWSGAGRNAQNRQNSQDNG